jgi:hypothetical protein
MKKIYHILFISALVMVMVSCKNDPIMFDQSKAFVAFVYPSAAISENGDDIQVPVMAAAVPGRPDLTVEYHVSTEGIAKPAVEGTDFTIISEGPVGIPGAGYGVITIHPIDNQVMTGNKSFKLVITSNSANYAIGHQDEMTITLKDDEHPLAKWIGDYVVNAVSYTKPGDYDEQWQVTTEPDENDTTTLLIYGVGGDPNSGPLRATISKQDMTITLAPGQSIGDVYGQGDIAVYKGTDGGDNIIQDEPIVGIIQNDGTMLIDLWGHLITSGQYANYIWDVFNTTWTKQP